MKAGYRQRGVGELWLVGTEPDRVLVYKGDQELVLGRGDPLTTAFMPGPTIDDTELFDR
jgi:hypothetical protein